MNKKDIERREYRLVTELKNKTIITLLLFIVIALVLTALTLSNMLSTNTGLVLGFITALLFFVYHAFRPRYCPECNNKMLMDKSIGLPSEYFLCDKCEVKVKTYIKRDNSL
jgi:hypothetical protein